jgi:hypothetical protein
MANMSNEFPSSSSIEIQTPVSPSKTRNPLFRIVAAPETVEQTPIRKSVFILGLVISSDTFWRGLIAKMESELCHLPIILYHGQWEHCEWEWRVDCLDKVDVVIPVWNDGPSYQLLKAILKIGMSTNNMVILHDPEGQLDVEKDGNCITVSTYQQSIDVTRAILEDKEYDYGTKIYYGTIVEFDYAAQTDGETGKDKEIKTGGEIDNNTDIEMDG